MPEPKFDVFLSHASPDKPVVEELARLLQKHEVEPWLDEWNLVPGKPWDEAIEDALGRCAACAVFFGPGATGPWQNEEMRAALRRQVSVGGYPVIPVLLPNAERGEQSRLPAFLSGRTWVEFHGTIEDEHALRHLIAGIKGIAPGPDLGTAEIEVAKVPAAAACPYRGLQFFDVEDSAFFHGREALIGWLLAKLKPNRVDQRFLAITGASGSGKSSLARAGLLASLKNGVLPGSQDWLLARCNPGPNPLENLALALADLQPGSPASTGLRLMQDLAKDPRLLHVNTRFLLRGAPADRRLVVLVDQFEEVFTLCTDEAQRQALISNLLYAAKEADGQTAVVITLRSDFYGRCAAYPDLAAAISDRGQLVGPMTEDELRSAIEGPARTAGLELEGDLADRLLEDVAGQPGYLPLLQHALLQLWQKRDGRRLTAAAYRQIGKVAGALQQHAEEIFTSFTEGEREACRRVLLRLVQVDETRVTRRRLAFDELVSAADSEADRRAATAVVTRLTDERLLTVEAAGEEKRSTVELAHEAMISAWKRFTDWIETDREALRIRRRLEEAGTEWNAGGRDPSYLYTGSRLAQAEEWARARPGEAASPAPEFLAASVAQREQELEKSRRRRRRAIILLALAAVAAVLTAAVTFTFWKKAQRQQEINLASQMAGQAQLALSSNPLTGLLLAAEAVRLKSDLPTAKGALLGALALSDGQPLGRPNIIAIKASADRRSLVTVEKDGTATLWKLEPGKSPVLGRTFRIQGTVDDLALSSDRRWLLVRDEEGNVRLLDLAKGDQGTLLPEEDWLRSDEPFSPDSRWLAMKREDTPVLHDLTRESPQATPRPKVWALAFSPDALRLALGIAPEGTAEIWNLKQPDRVAPTSPLPGAPGVIRNMAFSSDGLFLAAAQLDENVDAKVWRLGAGGTADPPFLLRGCRENTQVAVSPRGAWVFTWGGRLKRSCLWAPDQEDLGNPMTLPYAKAAAFSSDERRLAWGEESGAVRLRSLAFKIPDIELPGQGEPTRAVLFAPGDRWLVTQGGREAPRLWDVSQYPSGGIVAATPDGTRLAIARPGPAVGIEGPGGTHPQQLQGGFSSTWSWAFSPDGSRLVASDQSGRLLLWNLANGDRSPRVVSWPGPITSLAFNSKGDLLAVGGEGVAWLWDLEDEGPRILFRDPNKQIVTALAFDSGPTRVATGWQDGAVRVFGLDQGLSPLDTPSGETLITALAFSPDGEWLAITDANGKARLWKPGTDNSLENQDKKIGVLTFSSDGRWLASGGGEGILQLWNVGQGTSGVPVAWQGHAGPVHSIFFANGAKELITTGQSVRHWPLDVDKLIQLACKKAGRNLTKEEWYRDAPPGEKFREGTPCGGGGEAAR